MNGQDFLRIADEAFRPFLATLGFAMEPPLISGRSYRASFSSPAHAIWVSYEPGDEFFSVYVFSQRDGLLSDIDDTQATPRLDDLNRRYMAGVTAAERVENEAFFRSVIARDKEEQQLLKAARELRLVLPRYLNGRN